MTLAGGTHIILLRAVRPYSITLLFFYSQWGLIPKSPSAGELQGEEVHHSIRIRTTPSYDFYR
jgi:hypothetical protein